MAESMDDILHPGAAAGGDAEFPNAPRGWTRAAGESAAGAEGLDVTGEHWDAVRALQEYYARHEVKEINVRELHDALDEKFHGNGGIKHLYELFPGGPIAQGCRVAGLEAPPGAQDKGFGSVV